ncbi:MAG: hypothetical protein ACI4JB_05710 [Porcipelethomonas sp.]
MYRIRRGLTVFLTGAVAYSLTEIAFRGFTHWTMMLTGGIIFVILYAIHSNLRDMPFWQKCVLGSVIITAFEFTVGVIVNIILHWNVWDYSGVPLNFLGQICLPFTVLWFFLCIPAYFLCFMLRKRL